MDEFLLVSESGVEEANDKSNRVEFSLISINQAVSPPVDVSTFKRLKMIDDCFIFK